MNSKEKEADHWYKVGQSSGLQMAQAYLIKKAIESFGNGLDQEAADYRSISNYFKKQADEIHPNKKP